MQCLIIISWSRTLSHCVNWNRVIITIKLLELSYYRFHQPPFDNVRARSKPETHFRCGAGSWSPAMHHTSLHIHPIPIRHGSEPLLRLAFPLRSHGVYQVAGRLRDKPETVLCIGVAGPSSMPSRATETTDCVNKLS